MRIKLNMVIVSIFLLILIDCSISKSPSVIRIIEPKKGDKLIKGENFQVKAEIDVDYKVKELSVELWVMYTDTILHEPTEYDTTLWIYYFPDELAEFLNEFTIEKELTVPSDAPVNDNYRLEVGTINWNGSYGYGYSIPVSVHSPDG